MLARRPWLALVAVLCLLVIAGCARTVVGVGRPGDGVRANVAPSTFEIIGSTDAEIDTLARNALADINTYWAQTFPDLYAAPFPPLTGGYYSIDPQAFDRADYPRDIGCFTGPRSVADNAFYCFDGDDIVYDRVFVASLAQQYGRFIPALVMAHEFAHAIQARQPPDSTFSIVYETQADCFAGAWSAWVAADQAAHFLIRPAELDDVLRGFLLLRDEPGSGPTEQSAHGSYFDRVSAFQQGFDDGALACRDDFGDDRVFTQTAFDNRGDVVSGGNAPYDETIAISQASLDEFWAGAFAGPLGAADGPAPGVAWAPPALQPFDTTPPQCDGARERRDLTFCQPADRVDYEGTTLLPGVHDDIGDFAVSTLLGVQYAQAARAQLGLDYRGEASLRSSICLTGWYAGTFFAGTLQTATISPGDIDEAIQVLLDYGDRPSVLPDVGLSGFQLVDLFRQGFVAGGPACDVGL